LPYKNELVAAEERERERERGGSKCLPFLKNGTDKCRRKAINYERIFRYFGSGSNEVDDDDDVHCCYC
jgi:hypothetical protein